jgi:hypothetical protein
VESGTLKPYDRELDIPESELNARAAREVAALAIETGVDGTDYNQLITFAIACYRTGYTACVETLNRAVADESGIRL